ncbi:hypothetical protein C8R42DRAFT_644984 [Lentinula raphanica]|nr:hypothetical protein C8R42DRAFT_644984 [Lentinula raphanica]
MSQRLRRTRGRPEATGSSPIPQEAQSRTRAPASTTPRRVRGTNLVRTQSSPLPELTPEPENSEDPLPYDGTDMAAPGGRVDDESILTVGNNGPRSSAGNAPETALDIETLSQYTENSNKENIVPKIEPSSENILDPEQELVVRMAEAQLTDEQRESIDRRKNIPIVEDDDITHGESSRSKGKGVDPRNWGAVNLTDVETDENVQRQILDSLQSNQKEYAHAEKLPSSKKVDLDENEMIEFLNWRKAKGAEKPKIPKKETETPQLPQMPSTEERRLRDITEEVLNRDYPSGGNPIPAGGAIDRMAESNHVRKLLDYLKADEDPSSSDPGDSDDSSKTGKDKKKKHRKMRIKPIEPAKYNGEKDEQKNGGRNLNNPPRGKDETLYSSESTDSTSDDDSLYNDLPPLQECSEESDSEFDWEDSSDDESDDTSDEPEYEERRPAGGFGALFSFASHGWFDAIDEIRHSPSFIDIHRYKLPRPKGRQLDMLDPIARRAQDLLHWGAPYPGEDRADPSIIDSERFIVHRILTEANTDGFLVIDSAYEDREFVLPASTLEDPDFRLVHWFAKKNMLNVDVPLESRWGNHRPMGDAFKIYIKLTLTCDLKNDLPGDGLPVQLPSNKRTDRFNAFRSDDNQNYVVEDRWLGFTFRVPLHLLRDHRFDLVRWICKKYTRLYQEAFPFPLWDGNVTVFVEIIVPGNH